MMYADRWRSSMNFAPLVANAETLTSYSPGNDFVSRSPFRSILSDTAPVPSRSKSIAHNLEMGDIYATKDEKKRGVKKRNTFFRGTNIFI